MPPIQLSPGTALNDSKREAALKDLMADSQEEHFSRFPKAPRLDPKSPEREICQVDGDGAEKIGNVSVPFNIAELEQPGNLKPDGLPTFSSCAEGFNDGQASKEGWRARSSLEQEEMMGSSSTSATTRLRRKALVSSEVVAVMLRVLTRRRKMTTSSSTLMAARATRRRRGVDGTFSVNVFV